MILFIHVYYFILILLYNLINLNVAYDILSTLLNLIFNSSLNFFIFMLLQFHHFAILFVIYYLFLNLILDFLHIHTRVHTRTFIDI